MFCYYTSVAGWTMTDLVNDIAALCSGTLVAGLSASCNKAASYQTGSTISPGWTIHDSNTGQVPIGVVLSAPDKDGLTTKYLNIWGTSATNILFRSLESWDATNNTTVNASSQTGSATVGTAGVALNLYIFCTPEYIYIGRPDTDNALLSLEVLRDTPYLADATVKPLTHIVGFITGFHNATITWYLPRLRNPRTGATLLTTSAGFAPMAIHIRYLSTATGLPQVNQTTPTLDSGDNSFHQVMPLFWGWPDTSPGVVYHGRTALNSAGHGPCFTRTNIQSTAIGDIMVIEGQNYMYVSPNYGLLLPVM